MKIGIISMQRIKNYGSFLQAYGLKGIIEELGHDVEFIDYKVEKAIGEKEPIFTLNKVLIKNNIKKIIGMPRLLINRGKLLESSYNKYIELLGVTSERKYNTKVDTLVIGSDEVFNCLQTNKDVGYSKELFGANNNSSKLISYAACCGSTTINGLEKYGKKNEVAKYLKRFDAISVRDNNSGKIIKELTGKDPSFNLDPVFMYDFNNLIPNKIDLKNYIVVYAYSNRISYKERDIIRDFAKKNNKTIVSIGSVQNCSDICIKANPFEMLAYIKNADYIITDTFHGSVFSIKYNKKFVTLIRTSNKEKVSDLLNRFNLNNRELTDLNLIENVIKKEIDYKPINEFISEEINKTKEYLKANL